MSGWLSAGCELLELQMCFRLLIRGFYPKGGGEVVIAVEPAPRIEPIALTERGQLTELKIECYATREIPSHVSMLSW